MSATARKQLKGEKILVRHNQHPPAESMKPTPNSDMRRPNVVETYPLEMGYLPEKFVRKAEEELNETTENVDLGLKQMRELIQNDPNMSNLWFSNEYLVHYLRGRKYNVQKAHHVLKKFVAFVKKYKPYFQPVTPRSFELAVNEKPFSFMPLRDKDGCAIVFIKLNLWNPAELPVEDAIRIVVLFLTYFLSDPMTQVNGFKVLFDFKCNPLKYIRFVTPFYLFLIYHGTQECLPARFKAIHVVNPSIIFKTAWPIISPFMPEKLKKRVLMHDNVSKLHNYFPDSLIPAEYGGKLKDYDFVPIASKAKLPECVKYILGSECVQRS